MKNDFLKYGKNLLVFLLLPKNYWNITFKFKRNFFDF